MLFRWSCVFFKIGLGLKWYIVVIKIGNMFVVKIISWGKGGYLLRDFKL